MAGGGEIRYPPAGDLNIDLSIPTWGISNSVGVFINERLALLEN